MRGHNYSMYHFKITDLKKLKTHYFLTHKDLEEKLGIPRSCLYYAIRTKNGKLGDFICESVRIPKGCLNART